MDARRTGPHRTHPSSVVSEHPIVELHTLDLADQPAADATLAGPARVLVLAHGDPFGHLSLEIGEHGLPELRQRAATEFAGRLSNHLFESGVTPNDAESALDALARIDGDPFPVADPDLRISIVIPTRGRPDHLHECLTTLAALDHPNFEVLVADNGRVDGFIEKVVAEFSASDHRFRYLNEPNGGIEWARNKGIAEATGAIVAFTDDDAIADPRWLRALGAAFSDDRVGCVTGLVLPAALEAESATLFEQYGGFDKGYERRRFSLKTGRQYDAMFPYKGGLFGSGNNMAFRKPVIDELDGFDQVFGAGSIVGSGGDLEAMTRCVLRGYDLVYEPRAIIRHYHRAEYAALRNQIRRYGRGYTANLTKRFLASPQQALKVLGTVGHGLKLFFDKSSDRNQKRDASYPAELKKNELLGYLEGPVYYAKSARSVGSRRRGRVQ